MDHIFSKCIKIILNRIIDSKKGEETASIGQDNTGIGIASVKSAIKGVKEGFVPADHIGDENYPVINYVDSFLVDSDNVADYIQ